MTKRRRGPAPGSQRGRHSTEHFSYIGKLGGEAVKEQRGSSFYAEIGKKGGAATKQKNGREFYARIGALGGAKGRGKPKRKPTDVY
jgi:general stress protein YciG